MDLSSGGKGISLKFTVFTKSKLLFIGDSFDFNENKQSSMQGREVKDEEDHQGHVKDEILGKINNKSLFSIRAQNPAIR